MGIGSIEVQACLALGQIVLTRQCSAAATQDNSSRTKRRIETCAIIENLYCSVRESWKNGGQKWLDVEHLWMDRY